MKSSKKHKEKDKEKSEKHKSKESHKKKRKSKSPVDDYSKEKSGHSSHKKRREKRKHSDNEDTDAPLIKSSRSSRNNVPSRSPSPINSGGAEHTSLSIDETNKLRAKLGLKPLQVESAPKRVVLPVQVNEEDVSDEEVAQKIKADREKEAEAFGQEKVENEFVHAPAHNIGDKKKADKIRERIKAVREKRKIEDNLRTVRGLGDSDSDEESSSTVKWVVKAKKIDEQKALAEKRAKALAELDDEFGVGDLVTSDYQKSKSRVYSDKHLKGLKVLHAPTRFSGEETTILTLQDKDVLDETGDDLINVNMIDDEKYEKNVENRKARPELRGYNVFDDSEFDEYGMPKEKSLLSKYDEEIDGNKKSSFAIGEDFSEEHRRIKMRQQMQKANKILESLQGPELKIASDFYSAEEMVTFKKPKKKVRKVRKVMRADDVIKMNNEAQDLKPSSSNNANAKDLGSRDKKATDVNDVSQEVKNEPVSMEIDLEVDDFPSARDIDVSDVKYEDEADLDFQMALNKTRKLKQREKFSKQTAESIVDSMKLDNLYGGVGNQVNDFMDYSKVGSGQITLHATAEFCRTLGDIPSVSGGDIYGDEEMDFEREENRELPEERGAWNVVEIDETPVDITRQPDYEEIPILEQEPNVGAGVAGALILAMKKGYLDQEKMRPSANANMKHLQAQNYSIEDKNYEDERSRRDIYSGPLSDFKEKDSYKPEIKLEYVDEDGKKITSKEAFRLLSHKFHGKGSGKNKIDKKRRKHEQEKLMQQMNSTDTPLGTLDLLQQKQRESHSAYIVLSGKAMQNSTLSKLNKR